MSKRIGDARPSQIITTFGPGSIIDAKNDCLMIVDIDKWPDTGRKINDSRFASYMGVEHFRVPPTGNQFTSEDIPVVPFPDVHICSKCGRVFRISDYINTNSIFKKTYLKWGPKCPETSCGWSAYPSRFVMICNNGHIDDFDYGDWVHKGNKCNGKLKIYTTGFTSSLADINIKCEQCGVTRTLAGITEYNKDCSGHHPFRPTYLSKRCNTKMITVQRGASNVYFPLLKSAISIPPYTDPLYVLIEENLKTLESYRSIANILPISPEKALYDNFFSSKYSYDDFAKALSNIENGVKDYASIKESEYKAILNHADPVNKKNPFIFSAEEDLVPVPLKPYFSRIIRINRLREIMCLKGFTRLEAPDPEAEVQVNSVELSSKCGWLPGVEIHGEGIFIEFDKNALNKWINTNYIQKLDENIKKEFSRYCDQRKWTVNSLRGAIYMLMHTFSHLLIKEMGDKSGYSTSAIKERIYCSDTMNGILIYTGSSDKEGSLGGLVELGKPNKILDLIKNAFNKALICTNDPDCMLNELDGNINISACHSCCMISETACENGNRMLDRGMIVPIANEEKSYFSLLVKEMCEIE